MTFFNVFNVFYLNFFTSMVRVADEYDERVYLSVCLSVCVFVCLSGSISPKLHIQSSQFFRHDIFHRGSVLNSGGVAIRYVFPVLLNFCSQNWIVKYTSPCNSSFIATVHIN